jgi:LAO/AO transport system kinase
MSAAESPTDQGRGLAERLLRSSGADRAAIADALNLVDDRRPERAAAARSLLDTLEIERGQSGALRVGITGAPGAGKSTLIDACVRELRARGQSVGVIAVDPSSSRSGGALLGDRFRMRAGAGDDGVFVRSMAARDRLGGLADATYPSTSVLAAAFDMVLVETVGVGQSEVDVAELVDTLVFVAQPAAGDMLQFMKAGILEVPDIFVVNKADLGAAAQRTAGELESGLALAQAKQPGWTPPVIATSARDGGGIEALLDAVLAHRHQLEQSGRLAAHRSRGREQFALGYLERRYGSFGLAQLGGRGTLASQIADMPGLSAASVCELLAARIESALRAGS